VWAGGGMHLEAVFDWSVMCRLLALRTRRPGRPAGPVIGAVLPLLWHQGHTPCPGPERSRTAVESPRIRLSFGRAFPCQRLDRSRRRAPHEARERAGVVGSTEWQRTCAGATGYGLIDLAFLLRRVIGEPWQYGAVLISPF
jgi:hypothetical protein